jgi:predicted ABC-type ATPase
MTTSLLYLFQSTKAPLRKRLLAYFFTQPESRLYLREIAHRIQVDPANLSRELRFLETEGIFISEKRGLQKYFSLNHSHPLFSELKGIIQKTMPPAVRPKSRQGDKLSAGTWPKLYVVAGPNGAGKTTFAKTFLPDYVACKQFVNADLIAGGLSPFSPESAALSAGKLLLERIHSFSRKKIDFGFETTLSGITFASLFKKLKIEGYRIHLFFLWIPNVQLALARIADRVRRGGHPIPEPVVRRRFHKGMRHLFYLYRPLLDSWNLFDNSGPIPHLIASEDEGKLQVLNQDLFDRISKGTGGI